VRKYRNRETSEGKKIQRKVKIGNEKVINETKVKERENYKTKKEGMCK
jgi:hypothetical protein